MDPLVCTSTLHILTYFYFDIIFQFKLGPKFKMPEIFCPPYANTTCRTGIGGWYLRL